MLDKEILEPEQVGGVRKEQIKGTSPTPAKSKKIK